MKRVVIIATALACASPAVAGKFDMQLQAGPEQSLRLQNGLGAVDSHAPKSSARLIQHEGAIKKRGTIQLLVMNHGDTPFNVGPENLVVRTADGTAIEVVTYERLRKEEKKRQFWSAVATGLAAAGNNMNAANAGTSYGSGSFRGSTYGTFGNSTTSGTANWTNYNGGAAYVAQAHANEQNQRMFGNMADQNAARMEALGANLRTTTVDPQDMFGGQIVFELPKEVRGSKEPVAVTFVVTLGDEVHEIPAILQPR